MSRRATATAGRSVGEAASAEDIQELAPGVEALLRSHGGRSRTARNTYLKYLGWLLTLGVAWILWELTYRAMGNTELFFATPRATFSRLGELIADGTLQHDLWVTTQEFAIAGVIATVVGIFGGIVVGYFRPVAVILSPWLAAGYSTPLIALTPLFIIWFGYGIWSKVWIAALVMFFPILINTALGVSTADANLIEMMRAFSASRLQVLRKVILRGALPHITAGLRLGVGRGFTAVVAAELMGASAGMGYRILVAAQVFDVTLILAYVVVLAILGATLMTTLEALNERVAGRRT